LLWVNYPVVDTDVVNQAGEEAGRINRLWASFKNRKFFYIFYIFLLTRFKNRAKISSNKSEVREKSKYGGMILNLIKTSAK